MADESHKLIGSCTVDPSALEISCVIEDPISDERPKNSSMLVQSFPLTFTDKNGEQSVDNAKRTVSTITIGFLYVTSGDLLLKIAETLPTLKVRMICNCCFF
jgi:hypothetical protein